MFHGQAGCKAVGTLLFLGRSTIWTCDAWPQLQIAVMRTIVALLSRSLSPWILVGRIPPTRSLSWSRAAT